MTGPSGSMPEPIDHGGQDEAYPLSLSALHIDTLYCLASARAMGAHLVGYFLEMAAREIESEISQHEGKRP